MAKKEHKKETKIYSEKCIKNGKIVNYKMCRKCRCVQEIVSEKGKLVEVLCIPPRKTSDLVISLHKDKEDILYKSRFWEWKK